MRTLSRLRRRADRGPDEMRRLILVRVEERLQSEFFDPNYGECKFKNLADFKQFVGKISAGFCRQYHQARMDYRMFG